MDAALPRFGEELARMGGAQAFIKAYYENVMDCVQSQRPEVVGHFDLVCKNNEAGRFFDEDAPAYRRLALEALDAVSYTHLDVYKRQVSMFSSRWAESSM